MAIDYQKTIGILLLVILTSSVAYVTFGDKARLRIDEDQSTFYVPHEDYHWIWTVAGREQNRLFDGTSIMNRDKSGITINTNIQALSAR